MATTARQSSETSLDALLAEHEAAVGEFVARASAIGDDQWDVPRAPGKWTPAQETKHLVLGYQTFVRDIREGPAFRLKGKWWQRKLWRWFALPRILASGQLVRGAPAPRESRPPERPGGRDTLLRELHDAVAAFHTAVREAYTSDPRRCVTHPYFTSMTLPELARFSAVHARHHAAFLPEP